MTDLERAALERRLLRTEALAEQTYAAVQRLEATAEEMMQRGSGRDKRLERIEVQTTMTNGRVGKLELWRAGLDGFSRGATGSWHVFLGVGGLAVAVASVAVALIAMSA